MLSNEVPCMMVSYLLTVVLFLSSIKRNFTHKQCAMAHGGEGRGGEICVCGEGRKDSESVDVKRYKLLFLSLDRV